jgi:hypothetical protein
MESAPPAGDDRTRESSRAAGALGFLVLSAWCLSVPNRRRRFLLSYTAPVAWNAVTVVGSSPPR